MATGFEGFDRQIAFATQGIAPENIAKELAKFARVELAKAISAGASPQYERFVNNRPGLPEEAVTIPGSILYVFSNWALVINAALDELRKRVRSKSGRYASSFIVIAGGRVVTDFGSIPPQAEVIIVNFQPYTRKLDNARNGNRRHFLLAYHALRRRFGQTYSSSGAYDIRNVYLSIGSGVHPMIPYVLKGGAPLRAAAQNNRSSAFRAGRTTLAARKGSEPGRAITYPALVINAL